LLVDLFLSGSPPRARHAQGVSREAMDVLLKYHYPATCGNWRTSSIAPSCWREDVLITRPTFPSTWPTCPPRRADARSFVERVPSSSAG
jgi:hypothetical protein